MKILGLTGGIGSGKSVVSELLQISGIPVYDSDTRSKTICDADEKLKKDLLQLFGPELYTNGLLNRPLLAKRIFSDAKAAKTVNGLIHPAVERDFRIWVKKHSSFPMVAQESAILFEAGLEKRFDKIICVTAPEELRIERVCNRNGLSPEEVRERMKNQISETERIRRSDYILVNDGLQALIPQVEKLLQILSIHPKKAKN